MTAMVSIEGVLAEDMTPSVKQATVLAPGVGLFHALRKGFHVVLSSTETDEEAVRRWLMLSAGIVPRFWDRLMVGRPSDQALGTDAELATRRRHLMELRSSGYDLRYVVDSDPRVARMALEAGVTPLCCPHPLFARASFLPDSQEGGASWDAITAAVEAQKIASQDPRLLKADDEVPG